MWRYCEGRRGVESSLQWQGFPGGLSVICIYIFFLKADGPLAESVLPHRSSYHSVVFVFSQCLFIFNPLRRLQTEACEWLSIFIIWKIFCPRNWRQRQGAPGHGVISSNSKETPNLTLHWQFLSNTLDSERLDSCFGCYLLKASSNIWSNPCTLSFTEYPYVSLLLVTRFIPFCVVCHFVVVFLFKSICNNIQYLIFLLPKSVGGVNHSLPCKNSYRALKQCVTWCNKSWPSVCDIGTNGCPFTFILQFHRWL